MRSDGQSRRARLPQASVLMRQAAAAMAVALLLGYGCFVAMGPAVASPVIAVAWPTAALVFAALLLVRDPLGLAALAGLLTVIATFAVVTLIVEWDARSIWFHHARFIADGAGPATLLGPGRPEYHASYPKMLPLVAATVARNLGFWNEALPKLAIPVLLAPSLAYAFGASRSWLVRGLLVAAAYVVCARFLWNGYVDGILAVTAGAAMIAGLRFLDRGDRLDGLCFAALAALLPTFKTEGLLACGAVVTGLALRAILTGEWRRGGLYLRRAGPPLALGLAAAVGWFVRVRLSAGELDGMFAGDAVGRVLGRLGDGASLWLIWREMFVADQRFVWPLAALLPLALAGPAARRWSGALVAAAAVYLLGLTVVYLMTPSDLPWHLATSVDRTTIPPMLLLALALIPFVREDAAETYSARS